MDEPTPPRETDEKGGAAPSGPSPGPENSASIPRSAGEPEETEGSSFARGVRDAAPYIGASWTLTGALLIGVLVGFWADKKLGTRPWLTLLGTLLGLVIGFYELGRVMLGRRSGQGR